MWWIVALAGIALWVLGTWFSPEEDRRAAAHDDFDDGYDDFADDACDDF